MGGAEWLSDADATWVGIEAVVCPDPTGETGDFMWTVNDHGNRLGDEIVREGQHQDMAQAKQEAAAAYVAYIEKQRGEH
jgi:hypothetical protein